MLSKHISSITLFIVSEMTENPTAKYANFWCRVTQLINFRRSSVIVSVARIKLGCVANYAFFFGSSVISVEKNVSKEI